MSNLRRTNPYPLIISFLNLRRTVGVLSISMPAVLIIGAYFVGGCSSIQDSISHYYYTIMRDLYVGTICAVSLFLISYRGYDKNDSIFTSLAGIFLLGVAFLPTTQNPDASCTVLHLEPNKLRVYIHYASAVLFFGTLAYISVFLFTKGTQQKGTRKRLRNKIYRGCGVTLILVIIIIVMVRTVPFLENNLGHLKPVFWAEWIGLFAFGMAWLIKGELFFNDVVEKYANTAEGDSNVQ